jgi:hypothetical protein
LALQLGQLHRSTSGFNNTLQRWILREDIFYLID